MSWKYKFVVSVVGADSERCFDHVCIADRVISGLLTASNGAGHDFFGRSVGIDGDSKI